MRINRTIQDSIVDGRGLRFVVFTQGCTSCCPGCHNPSTHDPNGGSETTVDALMKTMLINPLTDGVTLSGGEPFLQPAECYELSRRTHEAGLNVWCYTGYVFEDLLKNPDPDVQNLLNEVDVLVDGPFLLDEKSLNIRWRGSRNQRVLDVKKSLAEGKAVWLEGEHP